MLCRLLTSFQLVVTAMVVTAMVVTAIVVTAIVVTVIAGGSSTDCLKNPRLCKDSSLVDVILLNPCVLSEEPRAESKLSFGSWSKCKRRSEWDTDCRY